MHKLIVSMHKELLLLLRDKAGLAVLFIMPAALVFVITLLQDAPIRNYQRSKIPLIFLNQDKQKLGNTIEKGLLNSDYFELQSVERGDTLDVSSARDLVARGKFRAAIIVPMHATENLERLAATLYKTKISPNPESEKENISIDSSNIRIYFDPAIQKLFKTAVLNALQSNIEKVKSEILLRVFSKEILNDVKSMSGGMVDFQVNDVELLEEDTDIVKIKSIYASEAKQAVMPNTVQHNVPAWSMFAMFFIALPLAGSMIKERESGSLKRLLTMPVSLTQILLAKVLVFIFVCLLQFVLMMMIGILILPMLGTPTLELGNSISGLLLIVIASAFAASGFGIMVGTMATSHEQASTFSAVSIILAAALGGVMVPVYLMPVFMQQVSQYSPLAWGLNAFLEIFVRGSGLREILPNSIALILFGMATLIIAIFVFKFRTQKI
jgi:ABC-2 type transport system permease protein